MIPDRPAWMIDARCRGLDPDVFFPERGAPIGTVKEICRECQVRQECLDYAIDGNEKFGVWGGMSERDRRRERQRRRREQNGTIFQSPHSPAEQRAAVHAVDMGDDPIRVAARVGVSHRTLQRWVTAHSPTPSTHTQSA